MTQTWAVLLLALVTVGCDSSSVPVVQAAPVQDAKSCPVVSAQRFTVIESSHGLMALDSVTGTMCRTTREKVGTMNLPYCQDLWLMQ